MNSVTSSAENCITKQNSVSEMEFSNIPEINNIVNSETIVAKKNNMIPKYVFLIDIIINESMVCWEME